MSRLPATLPPSRPRVTEAKVFGSVKLGSFWVEYPSGLVDLTRSSPLSPDKNLCHGPQKEAGHLDIDVDGDRTIRVDPKQSVIVIIDMQNFFLHPELRTHPTGLACVDPLLKVVPVLRKAGSRIIWLNWGLTPTELQTIPPSLSRSFSRNKSGGFGSDIGGTWGDLLMRGTRNAELYGPLQEMYLEGKELGTDVWMHKNRMGGLWGPGTALQVYLQEEGIKTLFFSGVNTDQCVLGTMVDAYFTGYDVIVVKDTTATGSPEGGLENVLHNSRGSYGFVTDTERIVQAK
ncbi:Isochorismatase hydrolase [Hysterangium stoloniferum]|nr:Isochorismatase hydrolase [Hysterangium stoloniferum]